MPPLAASLLAISHTGIPSLAGLVVIDVVEGTALASLPYMTTVLQARILGDSSMAGLTTLLPLLLLLQQLWGRTAMPRPLLPAHLSQKRPKSFTTLQQAVDWALDTGVWWGSAGM